MAAFSLTVREDYNDNIYLSSINEEDDFITRIIPGLSFGYEGARFRTSIKYSFEARMYKDNSEANDEKHTLSAVFSAEPIRRLLYIDVADSFRRVPSDIRRPTNEGEVYVNLYDTNTLTVRPYIKRSITPRTSLKAGYERTDTDYDQSAGEDFVYNGAFMVSESQVTPKLTLSLGYDFRDKDAGERTEDFSYHKATLSAAYRITRDLSIDAAVGNGWFDYEKRRSEEHPFWNVGVKKSFAWGGRSSARYSRVIKDSPLYGSYLADSAKLGISYGKRIILDGNAFITKNDYLTYARKDELKGGGFGASWKISRRLSTSVKGRISRQEFTNPDEKIDLWSAECGISYLAGKRTFVSARYRYVDRDSDNVLSSYTNNIYTVSVGIEI